MEWIFISAVLFLLLMVLLFLYFYQRNALRDQLHQQQVDQLRSEQFDRQSRRQLDLLLRPLSQQLESFKQRLEQTHNEQTRQNAVLEERIRNLVLQTGKVEEQAQNLAQALTGNSKIMGTWGETILERILEQSGLVKDTGYVVQQVTRTQDGRLQYPDVMVYLPDERIIVIDSKMSLLSYQRYVNSTDPSQKQAALNEHIRSVRKHVDELAAKNYDRQAHSMDFVLMFIPVEPAYLLAIQNDRQLWEDAYSRRIVLMSATNLIACLKLISDLWSREMQNRNAMEIARRGELLYAKFDSFVQSMDAVGKNMEKAQQSYRQAMNQLSEGNGNLISQAEKLKELGIKASRNRHEVI